jgi:hypothetical protein
MTPGAGRHSREPAMSGNVDVECAEPLIQRFISTYLTDKMLRMTRINLKNMMKAEGGYQKGLRLNSPKSALSHQDPRVAIIESDLF